MLKRDCADPAFQKRPKLESKPSGEGEGRKTDGEQGKPDFVEINRAPVLTLWVLHQSAYMGTERNEWWSQLQYKDSSLRNSNVTTLSTLLFRIFSIVPPILDVVQVTIVAEREGYSRTSALTFGKAIAGVMANAKGRRWGFTYCFPCRIQEILEPHPLALRCCSCNTTSTSSYASIAWHMTAALA